MSSKADLNVPGPSARRAACSPAKPKKEIAHCGSHQGILLDSGKSTHDRSQHTTHTCHLPHHGMSILHNDSLSGETIQILRSTDAATTAPVLFERWSAARSQILWSLDGVNPGQMTTHPCQELQFQPDFL